MPAVISNWKRDGGSLHFDIIIPPDTRARIELPAGAVTEIGNPENAAKATSSFEVGSGSYRFEVKLPRG